ncbi:glycosyltransferase family 4 protein [Agromyces sp. PvR057]|uniref:glycosyltransferase family 4 protein n=1 Tax=Agromyces sp. PvR057 TaxID=3156403 RepID=UPI003393AE62
MLTSPVPSPKLTQKLRRVVQLIRRARKLEPKGVLVARWHPFLGLVSPIWRRRGGAVILLVQGNDESLYETYPWFRYVPTSRSLIRRSLIEADDVLVLNKGLEAWVDEIRGTRRTKSVPLQTGVSEVFLKASPGEAPERPYVLFFGNLAPWQGIRYLLDAKSSHIWPTAVDLWIVGDGEDRSLVEASQGDSIRFLGQLPQEELAEIVVNAVATACTKRATGSMAETTTPFKMLESAAAGVPVIATDIPAQRRLLEATNYGLLVNVDDPDDFARAVARLAADPALHASLAANARSIRSSLSWAAGAEIVERSISRAMDSTTRSA